MWGGIMEEFKANVCAHRLHITSTTLPHYLYNLCSWPLNVFTCSMMHNTTCPEYCMSTMEKITVSLYAITV